VLISAALFAIITKGRVARPIEDLDDDTLRAIAGSSVGPEHAHLDEIIADWTPGARRSHRQILYGRPKA
jgi:hypothetical protein